MTIDDDDDGNDDDDDDDDDALVHIRTHRAVVTKSSFLERFGQFAGQLGRMFLLAFLRRLFNGIERSLGVFALRAHVRRTCKRNQ